MPIAQRRPVGALDAVAAIRRIGREAVGSILPQLA